MIKIDQNNFIDYIDAPNDGKPLGVSANLITNFQAKDYDNANRLIKIFDRRFSDIKYTSVRICSSNLHIARAFGVNNYSLIEIAMKVSGNLFKLNINKSMFEKFEIEIAKKQDFKIISDFATKYFNYGKFHEDPLIKRIISDHRNINMVNDLSKKYLTHVAIKNEKIIGFMILKNKNKIVELILGGMDENYTYLSYSFWYKIFDYYKNKGFKKIITTISSANIPIVNLYSRIGFKFNNSLYGFRKFR